MTLSMNLKIHDALTDNIIQNKSQNNLPSF